MDTTQSTAPLDESRRELYGIEPSTGAMSLLATFVLDRDTGTVQADYRVPWVQLDVGHGLLFQGDRVDFSDGALYFEALEASYATSSLMRVVTPPLPPGAPPQAPITRSAPLPRIPTPVITDASSPAFGLVDFQGLLIRIENPVGSYRTWKDADGTEGQTLMQLAYGELPGYIGLDGDAVDVFLGPDATAEYAFIVMQKRAPDFTSDDEEKVILGVGARADTALDEGRLFAPALPVPGPSPVLSFASSPAAPTTRSTARRTVPTTSLPARAIPRPPRAPDEGVWPTVPGARAARAIYLAHYTDPRFLGTMTAVPMIEFQARLILRVAGAPLGDAAKELRARPGANGAAPIRRPAVRAALAAWRERALSGLR